MAEQEFQKLLNVIAKTTEEITRLQARITDLQAKLARSEKYWGTDQVAKLNTQIERLQRNLAERTSQKQSLIDEKKFLEANKGIETLSRTIDTLQKRLDTLYSKRQTSTDPLGIEAQIKKYERVLSSFQARLFKAQGAGEVPASRLSSVGQRQGGLEGQILGANRINELGRNAANKMLNQIQNELLKGAIEASRSPESRAVAFQQNALLRDAIRQREQLRARQQPFSSKIFPELYAQPTNNPSVNYIPHPFSPKSPETQSIQNLINEQEKKFSEGLGRLVEVIRLNQEKLRAQATLGAGTSEFGKRISAASLSGRLTDVFNVNEETAAEKKARIEQEALNSVRAKIQAEKRYISVLEIMSRRGFSLEDLKFARSKGTAGVEEFRFGRRDQYGVNQQLDLFNAPSGRTTAGISNQFRTFGQGVIRDIGELTKWSIALAAVYGPMRKLQELTQIMIENQTKLADATISVSSAFLGQEGIFDIVATQADRAGESISGVIDAFTQAYRATGGTGDQVERLATAQKLLNDSLILSKLSTLDQATAIDTLSAAVRQTGGNFDSTTKLLDSWVRVTKVANVDLTTLSTGFAVLGDAAEAAGLDMNELNGLIALIAESSQSSGKEVANAARAIVGGLQSDQGVDALERLGIATRDTAGNMRDLQDILVEVSSLINSGVIDETQLSGLGQDIGGGVRRGAIVTTVLSNYSRALQVANESAKAGGDAQAALAKQLDTVQTSLTRLGNAFQGLAQTLGTEGGFLGIITEGVNGMTSLVKVFDSLTSVLGKATPALAAFIATSLILKQQGRGSIQEFVGGLGGSLFSRDPNLARLAQVSRYGGKVPAASGLGRFAESNIFGTGAVSGGIQGLLAAAIPAILNATNKDDRFGQAKAGANIFGGVAGGIIGSLTPLGPIIGAMIGTSIAEVFVNKTVAYLTDPLAYGATPTVGNVPQATGNPDELDKVLKDAEIQMYKDIGYGSEAFGRFLAKGTQDWAERYVTDLNEAIQEGDKKRFEQILKSGRGALEAGGVTRQLAERAFAAGQPITGFEKERVTYNLTSQSAQAQYDAARAARLAIGDVKGQTTPFTTLVEQNSKAFEEIIKAVRETSRREISQQRATGEVTGGEYGRRQEALGGFSTKAVQYYTALGDKVNDLTGGTNNAAKAFDVLNNVIIYGSQDSLPQITAITGEIQNLVNILEKPGLTDAELLDVGGIEGAKDKLEELRGTLSNLLEDANKQALLGRLKIPQVQGDINKPLTQEEFGQVKRQAQQLQDDFYKGFLKIPDDMYDALKGSFEEWAQIIEDSGKAFFETVSEIDPQFFQQAMQQLLEQGKLKSQKETPFGIQQLDITSQQGAGLQGSIDYFSRYLAQNFPQYEQKPEEFGVIFSDYVTSVLHGDNLAVKLALEKLVDINQKQLDGMYNIPEGATFWVPLTAAYYRPQNQGGAGTGLPEVTAGLPENTNATERNTQALDSLNLALQNEQRRAEIPQQARNAYNLALQNERRRGVPPLAENLALRNETRRFEVPYQTGAATSGASRIESFLQTLLQQLLNALKTPFTPIGQRPGYGIEPGNAGGMSKGFSGLSATQQVNPVLNARLDMRIDNSTQLMVDGRVLASVITPYLSNDLVRLEAAQGTITKRYII